MRERDMESEIRRPGESFAVESTSSAIETEKSLVDLTKRSLLLSTSSNAPGMLAYALLDYNKNTILVNLDQTPEISWIDRDSSNKNILWLCSPEKYVSFPMYLTAQNVWVFSGSPEEKLQEFTSIVISAETDENVLEPTGVVLATGLLG